MIGMPGLEDNDTIKHYCTKCGNYGTRLKQVDGRWYCTECRSEDGRFSKPKIPFRLFDPFRDMSKVVRREIRKRMKRR